MPKPKILQPKPTTKVWVPTFLKDYEVDVEQAELIWSLLMFPRDKPPKTILEYSRRLGEQVNLKWMTLNQEQRRIVTDAAADLSWWTGQDLILNGDWETLLTIEVSPPMVTRKLLPVGRIRKDPILADWLADPHLNDLVSSAHQFLT